MPRRRSAATWSTSADMRVTSSLPSLRVSTFEPIFTTIRFICFCYVVITLCRYVVITL